MDMREIWPVISGTLFGVGVIFALRGVVLGIRKGDRADKIMDRAQWPVLYSLLVVPIGFPRARAFALIGMALLAIRASWSFAQQRRRRKNGNS